MQNVCLDYCPTITTTITTVHHHDSMNRYVKIIIFGMSHSHKFEQNKTVWTNFKADESKTIAWELGFIKPIGSLDW